ncbi:hypothetical protein [Enterobacter cloacae]|uniref:hypothetical protein n=1 Tax=Enterobacter cloacae TaxID=550 RepID=UPI001981FF08|nr:hypothetical protein [Enterobacter cloacae]MBN4758135.1 hypothetical protein [Enterobacter cloacae]
MSFYIRKVDTSKWEDELPEDGDVLDMAVDGITNCCKTYENCLSVWKTESLDPYSEQNKKLLTAMAMSLDKPIAMTVVFLSDNEIDSLELELIENDGMTPYTEQASLHRDISNLTLKKIGHLGWVIHQKVNDDAEIKIISEEELVSFFKGIFPNADALPEEKRNQKKWKKIYE